MDKAKFNNIFKKVSILFPLISGTLWGSIGIFVRNLTAFGMDNFTILFIRMGIAVVIMFFGIIAFNKQLLKIKLKDLWLFVACGLLGMLGLNYFYNESINRLTLSLAAVLLALAPVFVIILSTIFFDEKITSKKILCAIAAFLGCVLVSGVLETNTHWTFVGILIGLGSAFFYALYSIFSRMAMNKGYSVYTVLFYSFLAMALFLIPLNDWQITTNYILENPIKNVSYLTFYSLCAAVIPYLLFNLSFNFIDTGKAAILAAAAEPSAAMVFGVIYFLEIPTFLSLVGLVITIVAVSILSVSD